MNGNNTYDKEAVDNLLSKVASFIGESLQVLKDLESEKTKLTIKVAQLEESAKVDLEKVANVKPQLVDTLLDSLVDAEIIGTDQRPAYREKLASDASNIYRVAITLAKQTSTNYEVGSGVTKESSLATKEDIDPDGWL